MYFGTFQSEKTVIKAADKNKIIIIFFKISPPNSILYNKKSKRVNNTIKSKKTTIRCHKI